MEDVFHQVKAVLDPPGGGLKVVDDTATLYKVEIAREPGKSEFFGMVEQRKTGVSLHLMPLYCHPELSNEIPDALKKKMTGKSCFKFRKLSDEEAWQLRALVKRALELEK